LTLFDSASLAHDEAGEGAGPGTIRFCLVVAYDGSGFRGFAAQDGQRTVAGELSRAISTVAGHEVELVCAGRTDAGVHASGQVVHVDVRGDLSPKRLTKAVNAMLGPCIVVRSATEAPTGFDARRSARARRYRYLVLRSDIPDPLLSPLAWHVRDSLELRSMECASDSLLGEHDFSAFCRRPPGVPAGQPMVRRVLDARWTRLEMAECHTDAGQYMLRFDISAESFAHQMVRSIVGTLVEVGRGKRPASDVTRLLRSGDRSHVKTIAPPHGLCLVGVDY
jgi:tRNA pseudouridine38-40 synthase